MHSLLTSALVAFVSTLIPTAATQEEVFVPANDVRLAIRCERPAYKIGEQIRVIYSVTNISGGAVFVPRGTWSKTCPPYPTFDAWLENRDGKHFIGGYAGDCSPKNMNLAERMATEAVLLKPHQSMHGYYLLETKVFKNLTPGDYRVEAAIVGWNDRDFDGAQRAELKKLGHPFLRGQSVASITIRLTR
jgi:hypothetical protein